MITVKATTITVIIKKLLANDILHHLLLIVYIMYLTCTKVTKYCIIQHIVLLYQCIDNICNFYEGEKLYEYNEPIIS